MSEFVISFKVFCLESLKQKMTKLGEWLIGLAVFFAIYFALLSNQINSQIVDDFYFEIQILPVILILLLGVSADDAIIVITL